MARVARAHGVNANQVFQWRRLYRRGLLGGAGANTAELVPVKIAEGSAAIVAATGSLPSAPRVTAAGTIAISVGKAQMRIEGDVDRDVLRMVLEAVLR